MTMMLMKEKTTMEEMKKVKKIEEEEVEGRGGREDGCSRKRSRSL